MEKLVITRAALGNTAALGDLYDIRRDSFCGINIFKTGIPKSTKEIVDNPSSDVHFIHSDTYAEKSLKLEVTPDQQASVLLGSIPLCGSGKYLNDQRESSQAIQSSLLYSIRTKNENLKIFYENLKNSFAPEALKSELATHVVVGISWGTNTVVSCTYPNHDNLDSGDIQDEILVYLKNLSCCISEENSFNIFQADKYSSSRFKIDVFGDILPQNEKLPTSFEAALHLIKKLPSLVASTNDGKGKPITFTLLPLSVLQSYLSLKTDLDLQVNQIEKASLLRVVQLFDETSSAQQKLQDFCNDVETYQICIPDKDLREVNDFKSEMALLESSYKEKLYDLVISIRSGEENPERLEEAIENVYCSKLSSDRLQAQLESWKCISSKCRFAKILLQKGVLFLKKNETLAGKLLELNDTRLYILFYSYQAASKNTQDWQKITQQFFQAKCEHDNDSVFFAVNQDIHPPVKAQNSGIYVQVYFRGHCIAENLFGDKTDLEEHLLGIPDKIMWVPDTSTNHKGDILRYAVMAGPDADGNPTYVCRGVIENRDVNLVPGKLIVSKTSKKAFIPYNGCNVKTSFEVLVCPPWGVSWQKVTNKRVPANAIVGGYIRGTEKQYIGRTTAAGGVDVGKVHNYDMKWTGLFYCHGDKELQENTYEVLVRNELGEKFNI